MHNYYYYYYYYYYCYYYYYYYYYHHNYYYIVLPQILSLTISWYIPQPVPGMMPWTGTWTHACPHVVVASTHSYLSLWLCLVSPLTTGLEHHRSLPTTAHTSSITFWKKKKKKKTRSSLHRVEHWMPLDNVGRKVNQRSILMTLSGSGNTYRVETDPDLINILPPQTALHTYITAGPRHSSWTVLHTDNLIPN